MSRFLTVPLPKVSEEKVAEVKSQNRSPCDVFINMYELTLLLEGIPQEIVFGLDGIVIEPYREDYYNPSVAFNGEPCEHSTQNMHVFAIFEDKDLLKDNHILRLMEEKYKIPMENDEKEIKITMNWLAEQVSALAGLRAYKRELGKKTEKERLLHFHCLHMMSRARTAFLELQLLDKSETHKARFGKNRMPEEKRNAIMQALKAAEERMPGVQRYKIREMVSESESVPFSTIKDLDAKKGKRGAPKGKRPPPGGKGI